MPSRQANLFKWLNQQTSYQTESLRIISADASNRRYYRFVSAGQSYLAVDAPPASENMDGFLAVAKCYRLKGIKVPEVFAVNEAEGFLCIQDFGEHSLSDLLSHQSAEDWYWKALAYLPTIQTCTETTLGDLPIFDQALIDRDFALFDDWFVSTHLSLKINDRERKLIDSVFSIVTENFFEQPVAGAHRDYHCRNLMVLECGELGVIDFQDALIAPITYDLASLLQDCYFVCSSEVVYALLQRYRDVYHPDLQWPQFKRWFDLTALQRHIKICGIFSRLYHRDGKAAYLQDIPNSIRYIQGICRQYDELADFRHFVDTKLVPKLDETIK